jgi:hypothetical protein
MAQELVEIRCNIANFNEFSDDTGKMDTISTTDSCLSASPLTSLPT